MTIEGVPDGGVVIRINQRPVKERDLAPALRDLFAPLPDKTLFVRAVGPVRYGAVVGAMDVARGAGVERFGIVTR